MAYSWAHATLPLALMGSSVEPPAAPKAPTSLDSVAPNIANPATQVLGLEVEKNNRLTIPVMIDDTGPFDFMIDTGSQATAVTHQKIAGGYADKFHAQRIDEGGFFNVQDLRFHVIGCRVKCNQAF